MALVVRSAQLADADAISDVLIRSITELCTADHGDRPADIADWTGNKSPDDIRAWINAGNALLVSVEGGAIGAVGQFNAEGLIQLLYVCPDMRGKGHSAALLSEMEKQISAKGLTEARLVSTKTAEGFYTKQGWHIDGARVACYRGDGQPMRKPLLP